MKNITLSRKHYSRARFFVRHKSHMQYTRPASLFRLFRRCLPLLAAMLLCFVIACLPEYRAYAASAARPVQREATLPVITTQMKEQARRENRELALMHPRSAGSPVKRYAPAAPPPVPSHTQARPQRAASLQGFSSNPFALEHKKQPPGKKSPKEQQPRVSYSAASKKKQGLSLDKEGKVQVSGKGPATVPGNRLEPRHTPFSGPSHTLPNMDKKASPEVSLTYEVNERAKTRLTVNPQDEHSPLYRPLEPEGKVNSAGVYMDLTVKPNLNLLIGGEYCDVDDPMREETESSTGAAVGLRWSF